MENEYTKKEYKLIKRQQSCQHKTDCLHSSYKCSLCGKWKDNLNNKHLAQIDLLITVIKSLEDLLIENKIDFISVEELLKPNILDKYLNQRIAKYIRKEELF